MKSDKKNPRDATLRNINALKARVAKLEAERKADKPLLAKLRKILG